MIVQSACPTSRKLTVNPVFVGGDGGCSKSQPDEVRRETRTKASNTRSFFIMRMVFGKRISVKIKRETIKILTGGIAGGTISLEIDDMSKQEKLEQKIRNSSRNVSLDDFEALINVYGYVEPGRKHPKAIIGQFTLPYKRENPVKPAYVKDLLQIINNLSR
jgi:hypothetical protein